MILKQTSESRCHAVEM